MGPNLISQDLRYNALPLYFSRPLRRIDYFLGKLGVIVAFLGMVIIVPSLIAYVLGLLFSLDITILRDTFRCCWPASATDWSSSVSAGMLMLALSSLSRNSRYIALFWLAVWFVTQHRVGRPRRAVDQRAASRQQARGATRRNGMSAARTTWPTSSSRRAQDRLAAAGVVHGQPVARRPAAARHRRGLGEAQPSTARPTSGASSCCEIMGPQYPVVLVGRRAGRSYLDCPHAS